MASVEHDYHVKWLGLDLVAMEATTIYEWPVAQ